MYKKIKDKVLLLSADAAWMYPIELGSVYLLWKVLHHFLLLPASPLYSFWKVVVKAAGSGYAFVTAALLRLTGEDVTQAGIRFQFHPSLKTVLVEEHCLAFPAMIIFSAAILLYGGSRKDKLWFVPLGLSAILLLNTLRLVFIGLTFEYCSTFYFSINHTYVYVAITYGLIFLMIAWWMKKVAPKTVSN